MRAPLRAAGSILTAIAVQTGPQPTRRLLFPIALLAAAGTGGALAAVRNGPPGPSPVRTAAPAVPPAERAAIEEVVRAYILAHPEIIPEAMQALRDRESVKAVTDNRAALEKPYAGAWEGAADGDVVLVEFFDYACGYCRAAVPDIRRLLTEDKRLKIVYRELPILGDESIAAARVGLLAADAGRYPAFHRAMYASRHVDKTAIQAAATMAGLDRARVQSILSSRATDPEFTGNIALAQSLGARGTPLFVIGDQVLNGAVGYDALKAAVAKARGE